jgi:electron transfer flavoprotein alpha subunit
MPRVLVVAETRRGAVRDITLELIGAAATLAEAASAEVTVGLIGAHASTQVSAVSLEGVGRVLTAATSNEHFDPTVSAAAVAEFTEREGPIAVLAAHSVDSMAFVPGVAARLDAGFASNVLALDWSASGLRVRRGVYSDKLIAELDFPQRATTVLMLRAGSFAPATGKSSPEVVEVTDIVATPVTHHLGFIEPEASGVDITAADFLLSVGRGIEDEENLPRFEALAAAMGAMLSVSRPLVDAGWAPGARQVGQSGKTVRPKIYLALGISGAVQHVAGMREAETIIAVNKDPTAPIFNVAHYGAVADLFEVTEGLERQFGA